MIKRNYIGAISLAVLCGFIILMILLSVQDAQTLSATYLKLTGASLIALIVYSALFAIRSFDPTYNKTTFAIHFFIGTTVVVFGFLIIFDVIPFSETWNLLVAGIVVFMTIVGLEIMDWNRSKNIIVKLSGIGLIITGGFLTMLFITLWTSHLLNIWLDIATFASIVCMLLGIIFSRKNRKSKLIK